MALPFVASKIFKDNTARDKWLSNDISLKIWKQESGRSILKALRTAGVEIRDKTFWDIRRGVLGLEKYEEQIRGLKGDTLVPKGWMVVPEKRSLAKQAQYRFSMTAVDLLSDEETDIFRAVSTDKHLTPWQAEEQIMDLHLETPETSMYIIQDIQLYEVWMKEGAKLQ